MSYFVNSYVATPLFLLLSTAFILLGHDVSACTSVMVGNKATDPAVILLARNEDFSATNQDKYLVFREYPEYYRKQGNNPIVEKGEDLWILGNGLKVPVPSNQFSYSAMPDAIGYEEAKYSIRKLFYFEERGINERNVAISATNSVDANQKAQQADPFVNPGIIEAIIPTLLLPQVETALHAVTLLGEYVETYGAGEGNGILIGDPTEAWYFEIGSGHHWIAVRIPADAYLAIANGMRVHGVKLGSPDVKHSKGLFEFVKQHQLLEDPNPDSFNFAKAFGVLGRTYNSDRVWLAQKLLTPSLKQAPRQLQYPLFLKPDKKIRVQDIMRVLRANYKGTVLEHDPDATRPIGYVKTVESHIITLDQHMPEALQGVIWQVLGTPLGAPYMPLYNVMRDIPPGYAVGSNQYSPFSAYWAFRSLYALDTSIYQTFWKTYEERRLDEHKYLNAMLKEVDEATPGTAVAFAKQYSTGLAYQTVGLANKQRNELVTNIVVKQGNDK